jgi:quercetin dioxygenase-like cupin family protein
MSHKQTDVTTRTRSSWVALSILSMILALVCSACVGNSSVAEAPAGAADTTAASLVIIEPDGGDIVWIFPKNKDTLGSGGELQIYVDAETHPEAKGSFAKFTLGPGGSLPVHKHDKTEELAYFISGEGVAVGFENGEPQELPVREGNVWYNPPGVWHSIKNTGDEPLVLVFAVVPNEKVGLLSFFRRVGAKPGEEATILSPDEFGRIAAEHDLILRPPGEGQQ